MIFWPWQKLSDESCMSFYME